MGKVPAVPKDAGEIRVFMLGGSTVVNGEPPIAVLLEEEFARQGLSNVKVYNFGVVSSGSGQELARTVFEVSEMEPDLVIFYNGGNDILHPWTHDPRPGYPFNFIAYEYNPLLRRNIKEYPTLAMIAYGSNIFRKFFPAFFMEKFVSLEKVRKEAGWKTEKWKEDIADIYVNNLIKADKVTRSFGARFIAFFQPLVYFKPHLSSQEKKLVERDKEKREYVQDMRTKILSRIERANKRSAAIIFDLSDIYKGVPDQVFTDDIHITQSGKNLIAKEIFHQVVEGNFLQ